MSANLNRRDFIGVGGALAAGILAGCSSGSNYEKLNFLDQAPDGPLLKAGLIGCGGRGTGAAIDFLNAGPNLTISSLGDVFRDRLDECREKIMTEKQQQVSDERCFTGFDAFEKVIDSGVDVIILATPPHFRPQHFAAAVQAKKHIFMEKPVAVDPVGARSVMVSSKKAEALGLCVGTGTQRRHQRDYADTYSRIRQGAIGNIVAANCYWNQPQLWFNKPQKKWTEMEYMIRDWVNWTWLSGDHIVEQHVHNIDVINWFTGTHPEKAVGFGARHRRQTGDQFDFFSVDFTYPDGRHVHSMCRQINNCANNVSEYIRGTEGYSNARNTIYGNNNKVSWTYQYPLDEKGESSGELDISPYLQEHIDLVTAIRTDKTYVEAEQTAVSTLAAIMGRISAYTGKEVTWEEMMNSDLRIGPEKYYLGAVNINKSVPVPGSVD